MCRRLLTAAGSVKETGSGICNGYSLLIVLLNPTLGMNYVITYNSVFRKLL